MAHIEPLEREQLTPLETVLANSEAMMGFVPNSMLTMAHMPQLTMAFSLLAGTVFGADLQQTIKAHEVPSDAKADEARPPSLIPLIAYSVSLSAGCRYCQAHTSHNAHRFGITDEQLSSILNFETSPAFSEPERAVVGLALAAGQVPNESDASHFQALKAHYTERQIVQIVAVIALFGFFNRWNDTMATQLEANPIEFAEGHLREQGWELCKHGR